ncbi:acyl carrier protein [Helcococcus sueciensis]|uniref:acyl carrier protein n=1 Tax=Helcococcus sueciensis TaxID=241555 RepID=UPI0004184860|nr:phosphopantetheine-binding protein [Helcococcus sueciensis]
MIRDKIIEMVREELMVNDLDLNANLLDDYDIDSIGLIEFIMNLEEEFDIQIEDEEIQELKSTEDVIKLVEEKAGN